MGDPTRALDETPDQPTVQGRHAPASDVTETPVRHPVPRAGKPKRRGLQHLLASDGALLESLHEVASVVSSRRSIEEVLQCVVDEAKLLLRCRKAVLWMFDEPASGSSQPSGVVVVRGSRDQYPEAWWRACVDAVAPAVLDSGTPEVVKDREHSAVLACVPVMAQERRLGVLSAINSRRRSFSDGQLLLLAVLGAFAGVAIENARLRVQSEYSLLAGERNRIAKEMHDGLAQSLFSASLTLEMCKRKVRTDPAEVEERLGDTQLLLSDSLAELRRYIFDLRPASLERLGLPGAISSKLDEIERAGRLTTALHVKGKQLPLRPSIETCLYRVMQEAVANAVKHAKATSVVVTLTYAKDGAELLVEDDGQGFDVEEAERRAESGQSLGLRSMRDRVLAEGGRLRIFSAEKGGTNVWVTVRC